MMATMLDGYATDPLWTVMSEGGPFQVKGRLQKYCEYLQRTERGHLVAELQRRHPNEFLSDGIPHSS